VGEGLKEVVSKPLLSKGGQGDRQMDDASWGKRVALKDPQWERCYTVCCSYIKPNKSLLNFIEYSPDLHGLEVAWPHVFAGVHAESLHSDVHEVVEIISDLAAHIILAPVQVVQAHQVAVPHLMQSMSLKERENIYLSS
jgi:hypothetical protein